MKNKIEIALEKIKMLILMLSLGMIISLSSCSFETYQCHSYGNTNLQTKHGSKAQSNYAKKYR